MKKSIKKSVTKKIVSVAIAAALILSVAATGVTTTSAAESTGVGLSAHALQAYNEHWSYVYGGTSYGTVDCSGLFVTYNGVGGIRTDLLGASSEWGYVSNGIPRIHGLGLHQPGHVGIYIGNDTAIDARNEYYGVCYDSASGRSWVEWFKVAGVSYPTTGWVLFNGDSFYYENGQYIVNTTRTFDGVTYTFGSSGASNIAPPSSAYSATDYSNSNVSTAKPAETSKPKPKPESSKPESSKPESSKVEESSVPEESSKPEETAKPEENSKPEESSVVEESSEPEESSAVEESSEPEESSAVEESSEPEESSEVEESSEPEESSEEEKKPEKPKFETIVQGSFDDGGEDTKITNIQTTLSKLGYFVSEITGYYGEATAAAVKDFQNKVGIEATGEVNEETWNAIFAETAPAKYLEYKSGDYDEEQNGIADIQKKLVELSYLTEDEYQEGSFDANTTIAVKLFQAANGLDESGDADLSTQVVLFGGFAAENPNPGAVIYGMSGSAVTKLQERLRELRYTTDEPTGVFDDATLEAVNAYQVQAGLETSNSLSAAELEVLYSDKAAKSADYDNLQVGYNGSDVKELEDKLTKLGYYEGSISGTFDNDLKNALEKYQDENSLSVTGVADGDVIDNIGKSIARKDSESSQGIIVSTATIADKTMSGIANTKTEKLSLEKEQNENNLTSVRNTLFIFLGLILVLSVSVVAAMVRSKRRMTDAMKSAVAVKNDDLRKPRYSDSTRRKF